jgi:hypothetical protein
VLAAPPSSLQHLLARELSLPCERQIPLPEPLHDFLPMFWFSVTSTGIGRLRLRTRIQNALQAIALANGLRRGSSLWSQRGQDAIASLALATRTAHRRSELQARLNRTPIKHGKAHAESQQRKAIQILTQGPAETIRSLGEEAADLQS